MVGFGCLTLIYSNTKLEIAVIDGLYQKIFKLEILKISVHMLNQMVKRIFIFKKSQPFSRIDVALHMYMVEISRSLFLVFGSKVEFPHTITNTDQLSY